MLSFLLNLGINDEQFDRNDQFRPNYNIGSKIWPFPLDDRQHLYESPIHIPVDNTPMHYQGTHPRWILAKKRKSKQNVMPGDEDTRTNGFISESKRSPGTLNSLGHQMCRSLGTTGNYIVRAICKVTYGVDVEEANWVSTSGNIKPSDQKKIRLTKRTRNQTKDVTLNALR